MDFRNILARAINDNASDIHFIAGIQPVMRINGELNFLKVEPVTAEDINAIINMVCNDEQKAQIEQQTLFHFIKVFEDNSQYKISLFKSEQGINIFLKLMKDKIYNVQELKIPEAVETFFDIKSGLVILTGSANSGKSATMLALVDFINHNMHKRIVMIEDHIEHSFKVDKSIINQLEIGRHTKDLDEALGYAVAESPDIIIINELQMKDVKKILMLAERGYLIIVVVNSSNISSAINNIILTSHPEDRKAISYLFARQLRAMLGQTLVPKKDGSGLLRAYEVLLVNEEVKKCFEQDGSIITLEKIMHEDKEYGMQSLEDDLERLKHDGLIDDRAVKEALGHTLVKSQERSRYIVDKEVDDEF